MNPERFARYDRALSDSRCDLYVSGSSADIYYLTGCEDGNAFLVYVPGRRPFIVIRAAGYNCAVESALADDIISFGLLADPAKILVDLILTLRPRRIAVGPIERAIFGSLSEQLLGIDALALPRFGRDLRRVKEPTEIDLLEVAATSIDSAMRACFETIQPGATDRDAAAAAGAAARRAGADVITFLQVKAGPRSAYPDAVEVGRSFGENEIGFIDMGVVHHVYRGDYTRSFTIGNPSDKERRIVEVVDRIEREALGMLRPGVACRDYYHAVHRMFVEAGYPDAIPHHLGHGIGTGDDSIPAILPTSNDYFIDGEVVCVEPGAYVRGLGGARIEDTVLIRSDGNRILSHAERVGHL